MGKKHKKFSVLQWSSPNWKLFSLNHRFPMGKHGLFLRSFHSSFQQNSQNSKVHKNFQIASSGPLIELSHCAHAFCSPPLMLDRPYTWNVNICVFKLIKLIVRPFLVVLLGPSKFVVFVPCWSNKSNLSNFWLHCNMVTWRHYSPWNKKHKVSCTRRERVLELKLNCGNSQANLFKN